MNDKTEQQTLQTVLDSVRKIQEIYNDYLTRTDKLHQIPTFEEAAPRIREIQKTLNDIFETKKTLGALKDDSAASSKTAHQVAGMMQPVLQQQRDINATTVHLLNELIEYLCDMTQKSHALHESQIHFFQQITPWIDVKLEALQNELSSRFLKEVSQLSALVMSLAPAPDRFESLVAQYRNLQAQLDQKKMEIEREMQEMWFAIRKSQASQPQIQPEIFDPERIRIELDELRNMIGVAARESGVSAERPANSVYSMSEGFRYSVFEHFFREHSDSLKQRLHRYIPYYLAGPEPIVDVGCGRGEFLQLMIQAGKKAFGIELNPHEAAKLRDKNIEVVSEDVIAFLRRQAPGSIGGVFCAQVVEHLPPEKVYAMLSCLHTAMQPQSALILETVNPLSVFSFHHVYFKDPTHIFPVHPETLLFLMRYAGFQNVQFEKISPMPEKEKLQKPVDIRDQVLREYLDGAIHRLNEVLFDDLEYFVVGYR